MAFIKTKYDKFQTNLKNNILPDENISLYPLKDNEEDMIKKFINTLESNNVKINIFHRWGNNKREKKNTIDIKFNRNAFEFDKMFTYAENFLTENKDLLNITFEVKTTKVLNYSINNLKDKYKDKAEELDQIRKRVIELTSNEKCDIKNPLEWYNYTKNEELLNEPYITFYCENNIQLYSYIKDRKYD
jgi:hypothetical protein